MHWLKFAVFSLSLSLYATNGTIEVRLQNDARLMVPEVLFHNVDIVKGKAGRSLFQSFDLTGSTTFMHIRLARLSGLSEPENLIDMATRSGLLDELQSLGLVEPIFSKIDDGVLGSEQSGVFRIDDVSPLQGHIVSVAKQTDTEGSSLFLLLSPESSFYSFSPGFFNMVERYEAGKQARSGSIAGVKVLFGTILLLILNLVFIWFGFREIAHPRDLSNAA